MSATRTERVRAIVLLLQHRLDYLDSAIRVGQSFPSKPGAQPTHRVACGCARLERRTDHKGNVRLEWIGASDCLLCRSTGFRARLSIDGDETQDERGAIYDPYVYAHQRSTKAGESGGLRVMTREETDRELAKLHSDARARAGVHLRTDSYGWEKARERRDRSGSFVALERALAALRVSSPGLSALVSDIFSGKYGENRVPPGAGEAYWTALLFVEARMPDPIRVPQHLEDTQRAGERREKVEETYRRTGSISKTAFSHGIRKARAKTILRDAGLLA